MYTFRQDINHLLYFVAHVFRFLLLIHGEKSLVIPWADFSINIQRAWGRAYFPHIHLAIENKIKGSCTIDKDIDWETSNCWDHHAVKTEK